VPRQTKPPEIAERNVRLVVEYDGTDFAGWQIQPRLRTVQRVLETAVRKVVRHKVNLLASGRTDAGVHAKGQVANFRTRSSISARRFVLAINSNLPADVAVLDAEDVPLAFHATHDAKSKLYRYRLSYRRVRPALHRRWSYWVRGPLDIAAMRRAAARLVGTHDFNSFRAEGYREKDSVRTVSSIDVVENEDFLDVLIAGDGFLYMMVRVIVGTLVRVGLGKVSPEAIDRILAARDRKAAGPTLPPHALCLMRVDY
jgi:tRNA pseudouridine38-40 synthase